MEEKKKEKEVEKQMAELRKKREKQMEEDRRFQEREKIKSLDDLEEKLEDFLVVENVRCERRSDKLYIYRLVTDPQLRVKYSVEIDDDLTVEVFLEKTKLPVMKLNNVKLVFPVMTPTLSVVQTIVKKMNGMVDDDNSPTLDGRKESAVVVKNLLNSFATDSNKDHINFILQQIDCVSRHVSHYRWSSDIITFLGFFMALFPRAYYFLMRSQRLTLPSPTIVKELSHEKFTYIPKVKRHASAQDTSVVLVINEVDVRPFSGVFKKKGYSTACVYVFSVSSLITAFKEVIYVTPVQTDYTPAKLHGTLLKLIVALETTGFIVVGLVSDNLPFNIDAVSRLVDPPKLSVAYVHPCDDKRPLFYIIDPAHTFKCIRDDWLITPEGIIKFPNFHVPDHENLLNAKFSDLKKLMEPPPNDTITYTHSITKLALNPVFPHKRDIKLVLQLFNDAVINDLTALSQLESDDVSETAQFINILSNWYKVAGFDSLDETIYEGLTQPLSLESESFKYLETLLDWAEKWGEIIENERSKLKAELEAQLAEKHAKQAERAAKAVLAELTGAKKRKRKRPKKSEEKDGESSTINESESAPVEKEQQVRKEPEPEVNEADVYQPNGNVNWVEQNLNAICGRINFQVPGQTFTLNQNNGYPNCGQNVYNYQQHDHHLFGIHSGYEFNHAATSSNTYYQNQNQVQNQYFTSCAQNYGGPQQAQPAHQNRGGGTHGQIMDLDAQPPVTVILGEPSSNGSAGPADRSQPPELLPIPKQKKPRTPKKRKSAAEAADGADPDATEKATESATPTKTVQRVRKPIPAQPPPVVIPQFSGGSRARAPRSLRFNFVKFETFTALKHSTYALLEITKYCIKELHMKHILAGKIHVDGLQMICVDSTFTPGADKDD